MLRKPLNHIQGQANSPAPVRTPLTPVASTSSSLDLKPSSWSVVMRAEAANWALAWSNVLDTMAWGKTSHMQRKHVDDQLNWIKVKQLSSASLLTKQELRLRINTVPGNTDVSHFPRTTQFNSRLRWTHSCGIWLLLQQSCERLHTDLCVCGWRWEAVDLLLRFLLLLALLQLLFLHQSQLLLVLLVLLGSERCTHRSETVFTTKVCQKKGYVAHFQDQFLNGIFFWTLSKSHYQGWFMHLFPSYAVITELAEALLPSAQHHPECGLKQD